MADHAARRQFPVSRSLCVSTRLRMIGTGAPPSKSVAMELWQRLLVIGIVLAVTGAIARLIDRRILRADSSPQAMTRYRVLRRSIAAAIVTIGLLSALLVIPQVRAVAG